MLQINHRCKYCCENFSRLSQLEKHTLTKHKIILTKTINDKRSQNKKYNQKNNKIEEKEIPQDDKHMGYEFTDIDIEFEESDILFEKQKR
ncbi:zinc finger protein zat11-like [Anaeramoeba flamelloides]|uniref:Zinc finger protein zat11-like n=1 Tax=Anaeramoeba flamelloides TaxID=1746091 RepID=A0ABQ8Z374_9EUKA|nr:zinc finger protein zat11-like [Anaeramoeba flamelloides]